MQTFNEFFIRELKPDVRPIAHVECDDVAVCAADCRLMAFKSIDDSLRLWIKVLSTFNNVNIEFMDSCLHMFFIKVI